MKREMVGYRFVRSETIVVDDYFTKERLLNEGFIEKGVSSKGDRLVKKSKALIMVEDRKSGRVEEIDLHDAICSYYGVQSLKNARVGIFIKEFLDKKVDVIYQNGTYKIVERPKTKKSRK